MALQVKVNADVGLVQGVTWATEVACTKSMRVSQLTIADAREQLGPRDHDIGNMVSEYKDGARNVSVNLNNDLTFGGQWIQLLAGIMGTATASPAEVNAGQGDYLHNLDIDAVSAPKFFSIAYDAETDVTRSVPSFMPTQVTIAGNVNGMGTVSVSGPGNKSLKSSATNTTAVLAALSHTAVYEAGVFNGANAYFRLDTVANAPLTSSDNMPMESWSLTISKPAQPYHGLRAALSEETYKPEISGLVTVTLQITLPYLDDSVMDWFTHYDAKTRMMAEIFIDGAIIGAGANRSLKFQFPRLKPVTPGGEGIEGAFPKTSMTFQAEVATSAPSGMSGVTNLLRVVSVDPRSTTYIA